MIQIIMTYKILGGKLMSRNLQYNKLCGNVEIVLVKLWFHNKNESINTRHEQ